SLRAVHKQQVSPYCANLFLFACLDWAGVALDDCARNCFELGPTMGLASPDWVGWGARVSSRVAGCAGRFLFVLRIKTGRLHPPGVTGSSLAGRRAHRLPSQGRTRKQGSATDGRAFDSLGAGYGVVHT